MSVANRSRLVAAGAALAVAGGLLTACASRSAPLRLPAGHPADPATAPAPRSPRAEPTTPDAPRPAPAPDGATDFVCPMHSDVRSPAPGVCPKCGMSLVPLRREAPQEPTR